MSKYTYVVSNHNGPIGVFLSRHKAEAFVRERRDASRVDRFVKDAPLEQYRFSRQAFIDPDWKPPEHYLPFNEERYGFD